MKQNPTYAAREKNNSMEISSEASLLSSSLYSLPQKKKNSGHFTK